MEALFFEALERNFAHATVCIYDMRMITVFYGISHA